MVRTNFFYRYGRVSTNKMWNKPSWSVFWKWWNEFTSNVDLEDYSFYLGGSFVINENIGTDIDVMITGPIYDYEKLYKLFEYGLDLSLNKYGIYVDLCWWDNVDFCMYPRNKDFFRYHNMVKMGGQEYKVVNDVCILDLKRDTFDKQLEIPSYISFNRVILPMEKQRLPQYQYKPIKLH